ncbi:MAG: ADP-ribosylglycohydrolase family protein [Melioribacteraceae bacterium]|nr:ADP-ribosylglycohydrolase family protein [Melioribacteraceae bacterium]MCF8263886.1 ADP-ribosylglycohydrolase family protein [Melioribacteraceae bacterium]MCF8430291.1 ADP-ribosylglycohydrolase family protein [Melioribacteraceae bacterium]
MKRSIRLFFTIVFTLVLFGCQQDDSTDKIGNMDITSVSNSDSKFTIKMTKEVYHDKILGALVGSAIGDAMGAPTEMWQRYNRQIEYGFVDSLDPVSITPSAEGVWDFNLPKGATTDDTRWKVFMGKYMIKKANDFYGTLPADPFLFAEYVTESYEEEMKNLKSTDEYDTKNYELNLKRIAWLQEWALVANAFETKDIEKYNYELSKFYGGDILCAGMLYAPMVGLPYPGNPLKAYESSFRLAIFDQGYAKDVTALTSAMQAAAMDLKATPESVMSVFRDVDPNEYFSRRIFGRLTYQAYKDSYYFSEQAKAISSPDQIKLKMDFGNYDPLFAAQMQKAFNQLDSKKQEYSPHAKEILMISITAMMFCDFDFRKTMEFITNYGRDNDTAAAVAGSILGAYHGFNKLPKDLVKTVLETNKTKMGIDLEILAQKLTDSLYSDGSI